MFTRYSFINSVGEYAYDCENRSDMLLRSEIAENVISLNTQYGTIVVTPETLIATGRGLWKRADELCVGDSLKHYTMNRAVITSVTTITDSMYMCKLVDCKCGYLVIDGFYVASDM